MDQPKPTTQRSSFSVWKIIKHLFLIFLVAFIAIFGSRIYSCFFSSYDIKQMRGRFLNSNLIALPSYCKKYDKIAHNAYDPKNYAELESKIEEYQGSRKNKQIGFFPLLLNGQFEHFPRKNFFYFSHDFKFNFNNFLKFKREILQQVCKIPINDKARDLIQKGDKKLEKELLTNYSAYGEVDKLKHNSAEVQNIYANLSGVVNKFNMIPFFKKSLAVLKSVNDQDYYQIDKSSGPVFNALKDFLMVLYPDGEYLYDLRNKNKFLTNDADAAVHMILKDMGMGRGSPACTFVFSRIFYGIYYLTLDIEIKDKANKVLKSKERIDHVFAALIYHFSRIYPESEVPNFLLRFFKPKMQPVDDDLKVAYDKTLANISEGFENRVNSLN